MTIEGKILNGGQIFYAGKLADSVLVHSGKGFSSAEVDGHKLQLMDGMRTVSIAGEKMLEGKFFEGDIESIHFYPNNGSLSIAVGIKEEGTITVSLDSNPRLEMEFKHTK